jgi:hypothetical protein
VRYPTVVSSRDGAEYQVGNLRVDRGGDDGTALRDFGVHPGLERSRQREHCPDPGHRRDQSAAVIKGAANDLNATLGEAPGPRFTGSAHHRANPHPAIEQRGGHCPALSTGSAQHQNRLFAHLSPLRF